MSNVILSGSTRLKGTFSPALRLAAGSGAGAEDPAAEAADRLASNGMNVTVADARFAKPLDTDLINDLVKSHEALLIVEEGSPGGFSAHLMTYLANQGHLDGPLKVRALTLPDIFIDHDSQKGQLALAGLDADGIYFAARKLIPLSNEKLGSKKAKGA